MAVQLDGKFLVGGSFPVLGGRNCTNIVRLNSTGVFDTNFSASAGGSVICLALQSDGKILAGGGFTNLDGIPCSHVGRFNPDGSLDTNFSASANGNVFSLALQTDGKIVVAGSFTNLDGTSRTNIGRLNADGTFDSNFNVTITISSSNIFCLAMQADGKIFVAGNFTNLAGQTRNHIGRLNNTETATENLFFDGTTVTWLRGGTCPEASRTTFDFTTNGSRWISLGLGARIQYGWLLGIKNVTQSFGFSTRLLSILWKTQSDQPPSGRRTGYSSAKPTPENVERSFTL
jgi:uncharacterized delta-60 repeat protein